MGIHVTFRSSLRFFSSFDEIRQRSVTEQNRNTGIRQTAEEIERSTHDKKKNILTLVHMDR